MEAMTRSSNFSAHNPHKVHKIRAGTKTAQVVNAIRAGKNTLNDIRSTTGIDYRTINAIVASLEDRGCIYSENAGDVRKHQRFFVGNRPSSLGFCMEDTHALLTMGRLPANMHSISGRIFTSA